MTLFSFSACESLEQVYRGNESDNTSGLRMNDMILSMNGKSVGGMTELGLSIELEVCGPELELVVSRYKHSTSSASQALTKDRQTWESFDREMNDSRRLDWYEVNAPTPGASSGADNLPQMDLMPLDFQSSANRTPMVADTDEPRDERFAEEMVSEEDQSHSSTPSEQERSSPHQTETKGFSQITFSQFSPTSETSETHLPNTQKPAVEGHPQDEVEEDKSSDSECWSDDDEAWLGCVCGEIHPDPIPVFWVQCEECNAWYNVAPKCVGFSEKEAASVERWTCRACTDSVAEQSSLESDDECTETPPDSPACPAQQTSKVQNSSEAIAPKPARRRSRQDDGERKSNSNGSGKTAPNGSDSAPRPGASNTTGEKKRKTIQRSRSDSATSQKGKVYLQKKADLLRRTREDGCVLPATTPRKRDDGTYAHPTGRCPTGLSWDATRGLFAPKVTRKHKPKAKKRVKKVAETSDRQERKVDLTRRMTKDGHVLPASTPQRKNDGLYARPRGRGPAGTIWDPERGIFVSNSMAKTNSDERSSKRPRRKPQKEAGEAVETPSDDMSFVGTDEEAEALEVLPVGTLVSVAERVWPGSNQLGGIGKIIDYRAAEDDPNTTLYDVRYVLGGREKGVHGKYVSRHDFLDS